MPDSFEFGGNVVWKPTPDYIEHANLTRFMRQHGSKDFKELMHRSTKEVAWFTDAVLKFLNIEFYLDEGIQFPKWCVGGKMNIIHNCVDKYQSSEISEQLSVVWEGEEGETRSITYAELFREVNKVANALRSLGLGKGDAVGLYMPMTIDCQLSLL